MLRHRLIVPRHTRITSGIIALRFTFVRPPCISGSGTITTGAHGIMAMAATHAASIIAVVTIIAAVNDIVVTHDKY